MMPHLTNNEPIILIGPMKCGKSTVGKLLAEQLNQPFVSLDVLERHYSQAVGFDDHVAVALKKTQGDLAWYGYRRDFFDEAVIRFLKDYTSGVLELGGGHPILPDIDKQVRINEALAPFRNVVLLLPDANLQTSLDILKPRQKPERLHPDLNELFLKDNRFFELAKFVVYTKDKSPTEVCQEIIETL
jgi:shikimate kinase